MTPPLIRSETRRRLNGLVSLLCPSNVPDTGDVGALRQVRDGLLAEARWLNSVLPTLEREVVRRARLREAAGITRG